MMKRMKKTTRQFDVVPVAVVLQTAGLLKDDDFAVEVFEKKCAPAGADTSHEALAPSKARAEKK
jgi:hypothetical protein